MVRSARSNADHAGGRSVIGFSRKTYSLAEFTVALPLIWLRSVLRFLLGGRYLAILPPYFSKQLLFDRQSKRVVRATIQDLDGWYIIKQVFLDEDYSIRRLAGRHADIVASYKAIIDRGETPLIIDCGANIGLASRYFVETFPEARIVSVEPFAKNADLAEINTAGANVQILRAGISSRSARANIFDPGLGNNGIRVAASAEGDTALLTIKDILLGPADGATPFLAKIDIEGFEADLFEAEVDWIDRFPLLVVELHDWMLPRSASSGTFLRAVASRNRDFVHLGENVFSIAN